MTLRGFGCKHRSSKHDDVLLLSAGNVLGVYRTTLEQELFMFFDQPHMKF